MSNHLRVSRKKRSNKTHRAAVGEVPGTLVAAPFSTPTEVRLIRYHGSSFREDTLDPVRPSELVSHSGDILWVDVDGLADTEAVAKIGEHFAIHHLAMEDVLYSHQSKAYDFGSHLQICFPTLAESEIAPKSQSAATEAISMFVGANFVLTFQAGIPGDPFEPVRVRLRQSRGQIRERSSDYLAYALLDATIDAYFPLVDAWSDQLVGLEERVMSHPTAELWNQICTLRAQVLTLRRTLRHFREAIAILVRYEGPLIAPDNRPFFSDLHDHLMELVDALDELRETTGELMQTFHARQSQRTNDIMQVLTIISTIFIPLSFIAGVYGMNFDRSSRYNMPELGWVYGYPFALGLMGIIGVGFLNYFWRKGWIGSRNSD